MARAAQPGWAAATAYNRGQVLYRVAEVMESRRPQLVQEVRDAEGLSPAAAEAVVSQAIDRWVWYAGWSDKYVQILGGLNPVAGADDSSHQYFGEASVDNVQLADNEVVLLNHLCYASGNTEPGLPEGTLDMATQRVDNYAAGFIRTTRNTNGLPNG